MKALLLILSFLLSLNTLAAPILHDIAKGKHHKGGEIKIAVSKNTAESFTAKISYKIKKKFYVPVGDDKLKGGVEQALPKVFSSKEGYLNLMETGILKVDRATIRFIKREDVGKYYDSFKIEILPDNGKWKGYLWYHPSVSGVGWIKSKLTLLSIPILGDYSLSSLIRD